MRKSILGCAVAAALASAGNAMAGGLWLNEYGDFSGGRASAGGAKSGRIRPLLGEAFLISAITALRPAATRAASASANPRTGEAIKIKAAKVPKFRPGKALKDALN